MASWANPESFAHVWTRSVEARPQLTFLVFEGPEGHVSEWTYAEFDRQIGRVAALLVERGVTSGSAVHMALANSPAFVAIWLATNRLGAWIVPSDPMAQTPELADHITRTNPVVGFCAADRSARYAAATDIPFVELRETSVDFEAFPITEFVDWPDPGTTDRAAVMFTSGTTGKPKGVEVTQANYAFAGKVMAEALALNADDRQLVVLPLFHANAQYYSFASAIWVGASVALIHRFSASGFLPQAARHRATCASLFAAPIRMILARGKPVRGLVLRHCWFAQNISRDQYTTITEWLGCAPRQLYGMTETIPAVLTDETNDPRPESMGRVTAGCEVELHDTRGRPCASEEVGEVVVRGDPGITIFAGYLDDPTTTESSFSEGWFHTGDRAWRDSDGRHYFDGRRSDVLKVAGENVSTVEVESVLSGHPGVLEASVVGAPDPVRDEVPVAFVVLGESGAPTVDELHAWCQARLGRAKQPRDITLLEELPRTSVGKIRKFVLKEQVTP